MRAVAVAALLLVAYVGGCSRQKRKPPHDAQLRNAYIATTVARLRAFRPNGTEHAFDIEDVQAGRYIEILSREAFLRIGPDEWVYVIQHDHHQDDRIGNVTLAIDHLGRIWKNGGHGCGHQAYWLQEDNPVVSAGDFLATVVGTYPWVRYEP